MTQPNYSTSIPRVTTMHVEMQLTSMYREAHLRVERMLDREPKIIHDLEINEEEVIVNFTNESAIDVETNDIIEFYTDFYPGNRTEMTTAYIAERCIKPYLKYVLGFRDVRFNWEIPADAALDHYTKFMDALVPQR